MNIELHSQEANTFREWLNTNQKAYRDTQVTDKQLCGWLIALEAAAHQDSQNVWHGFIEIPARDSSTGVPVTFSMELPRLRLCPYALELDPPKAFIWRGSREPVNELDQESYVRGVREDEHGEYELLCQAAVDLGIKGSAE